VGDQAAFKVEYLDEAITIKPLRAGAKSNLYVYTDFRRFNVQLVTGAETSADYVVYLENPKEKKVSSSLHWTWVHRSATNDGIKFTITREAGTSDGVLVVEFDLSCEKRGKVEPAWIWLTQDGATKPIQNLYLSNLECSPGNSVSGSFQILKSDINENTPLRFELRRKKTSTVTISKVATWK
jgi:sulfate adenylyltransferase subunit 1 (EFTu-like GTPase family)